MTHKPETIERARRAAALRSQGLTFVVIGQRMGITATRAKQLQKLGEALKILG